MIAIVQRLAGDLPAVPTWERVGLVTVCLGIVMMMIRGSLVPGRYYNRLQNQLVRSEIELDNQRGVTREAIAAMSRLAERLEQLLGERSRIMRLTERMEEHLKEQNGDKH